MLEEWLLSHAGDEAGRARLRHLIHDPPRRPSSLRTAGPGGGSTPRRARPTGISLAEAQRIARDAEEYDREMTGG